MILKYIDQNGKENIKNVKMVRKGFTMFEYELLNGQVIELENIKQFWIGESQNNLKVSRD
uniref:ORF44 n=1 Tax=Nitrosopumilaceae spindle-shaped virus TaxID=3065433 RepID=A0AAT9J7M3_9VIRU